MADPFGGTGGGSGQGSVSVGGSQVISPLAIPELLQLFNRAQAQTPMRNDLNSVQGIVQGGMNSPLLEAILGPALQRLQAPQAQARQNLTEATRAAGGLRGSTYGQDFNQLQNNQALQSNDLIGQVIQQMLAPLISGQLQEQRNEFLPAETLTNLLKAASPSVARGGASASLGWDNIPPSLGLQTPTSVTGNFGSGIPQQNYYSNATVGPNAGGGFGGGQTQAPSPSAVQPYTPYLDPMGGVGGGSYDLGMGAGTQWLGGPQQQTSQITYGPWQDYDITEESFF